MLVEIDQNQLVLQELLVEIGHNELVLQELLQSSGHSQAVPIHHLVHTDILCYFERHLCGGAIRRDRRGNGDGNHHNLQHWDAYEDLANV